MKEAEWTPSPVGERDRAATRRRTSRVDAFLILTAAGLSVAGIVSLVLLFSLPLGEPTLLCGACVLLCAFVLTRIAHRNRGLIREIHLNERGLVEEFGHGEGWLVDVMVLQGAAPSGTDRGMLWIENGRLLFSGYRTSFALSPNDVAGPTLSKAAVGGLRYSLNLPLSARTPGGRLSLSFKIGDANAPRFRRTIHAWAATPSEEAGQLPPLAVGPGAAKPTILLGKSVAYFAASASFLAFFLAVFSGPILLVGAVWPIVWIVLGTMHLRAWRDRRTLDRAQSALDGERA